MKNVKQINTDYSGRMLVGIHTFQYFMHFMYCGMPYSILCVYLNVLEETIEVSLQLYYRVPLVWYLFPRPSAHLLGHLQNLY